MGASWASPGRSPPWQLAPPPGPASAPCMQRGGPTQQQASGLVSKAAVVSDCLGGLWRRSLGSWHSRGADEAWPSHSGAGRGWPMHWGALGLQGSCRSGHGGWASRVMPGKGKHSRLPLLIVAAQNEHMGPLGAQHLQRWQWQERVDRPGRCGYGRPPSAQHCRRP